MRLLQTIVDPPHPCVYLPEKKNASLETRVMLDVTPDEYEAMMVRGWRRFGPCYFRPVCADCMGCVTLRVPAATFAPSKSQRRALKATAKLRRVWSRPRVDAERLALYAKWHTEREGARGWDESEIDDERYRVEFAFPHPCAREIAFYDDGDGGKLVGVGLVDETPSAFSAVYFFYDPARARDSLGVANVASLILDAKRLGVDYVYLGYRVLGCASLEYKGNYRPHELLVGRPGPDEVPRWISPG
ncbi:arginyltransferase [soil metagenome]